MSRPHLRTLERMPADRRATWENLVSGAVVALVAAVYMVYAVRTGLPFGAGVRALAATAVFQVLPGALLWRLVRPRRGWLLEDLAMGFALGIALAVPTQVVAGLTQQRWVAFALPLLVTAVLVGIPRARRRIVAAQWGPIAWWLSPLVSLVSFWAVRQLVTYFRVNQITWQGPGRPHIDAYLHQALASQLLHRGPTSWPTVMGEDLGYHWFTHAWLAHVTATSGAGLDLVLLRVMPALMPLAVVVCVMVAALRLSGSPKVALLASVLAMAGSYGNPFGIASIGLPLTPDSPTLALGVPTLLALVLLLDQRWSGNLSRGGYLLIPVLSVIAAGTKGATSPLVVAGLGLALVGMLVWNRKLWLPVLVDLVVVAAGLLFAVVFVFHGSSAGLALGITDAAKQTYVFTTLGALPDPWLTRATAVLVVLGGLTRAALSFAPLFGRVQRRHPLPWLLAGGSLAGAGAVGVFSHPGQSQGYFLSTAIPLAALGSALGARALARALGPERVRTLLPLAVAGGALIYIAPTRLGGALTKGAYASFTKALVVAVVLVVLVAVAGWVLGGPAHRWRSSLATVAAAGVCVGGFTGLNTVRAPLFPEAKRPASTSDFQSISQDQLDAARWIRDHSDVDDVVMTNRHCTTVREPRGGCDSRRWVVTAFSERQSLVEGWTATPRATEIAPEGRDSVTVDYWRPDILELNDGFIAAPTEAARTRLWNLGVRWVYVDTLQAHADTLAPYAELGFDSPDATAWKLLPPG